MNFHREECYALISADVQEFFSFRSV
ncbi:unnamed protein product, partial [Rotaria sp. Silwood1]